MGWGPLFSESSLTVDIVGHMDSAEVMGVEGPNDVVFMSFLRLAFTAHRSSVEKCCCPFGLALRLRDLVYLVTRGALCLDLCTLLLDCRRGR
jgi:hypothetical protein